MDLYTKYCLVKLIASQSKRKTVQSFWERLFTSFYGTSVSQWEIYVMSMRSCVLTIFWGLFGFRCCFCLILSIYLPYFCLCFFYCTVNPSERLKNTHACIYMGTSARLLLTYRLIADLIVITHRHIHALTSQTLFLDFSGAIAALDDTNLRTFITSYPIKKSLW